MRTAPGVTTALSTALAGTVDQGGGTARLQLRTGNAPASISDPAAGTLLVEFALPSPAFMTLTGGALAHPVAPVAAVASGTVGHYRVLDRSGACVVDGQSVGTTGTEVVVPSLTVVAGQAVSVAGWALGAPVNTAIAAQSLPSLAQAGAGSMVAALAAAQALSPFTQALAGATSGGGGITAPTAAYTLGTQVGVPTGTSLTATSGLPAADATETLRVTNPITGAYEDRSVSVWRRRRWTTQLDITPPAGATYLFDECEWDVSSWRCVDVSDTNGTSNPLRPLAYFRRCTFDGNNVTKQAVLGNCVYLEKCHLTGAEDGFAGAYASTVVESNLLPTTGGGTPQDEHSDGFQNAGGGICVLYRTWAQPGTVGPNVGIRVGTEYGACADIWVHYCGISANGAIYSLQLRGDAGSGGGISNVSVVGNKFTTDYTGVHPADFEQVTGVTWSDNTFIGGGTVSQP